MRSLTPSAPREIRSRTRMRALVFVALSLLGSACTKPAPPTLSPKRAAITSISPDGVALDVLLGTTNPNAFNLTAGDVTAHFVLDGTIDVGTATFPQTITLPANSTKDIEVPITLHWGDIVPLLAIAASDRPWVPYAVDGSLALGGDLVQLQVPFHITGTVTREEILRATVQSIPGLPGVPLLPGAAPVPGTIPRGKRAPPHGSR